MWLITTRGFYSVVQDRSDPDVLIVRARRKEDLQKLPGLDVDPPYEIIHTPRADYPFRLRIFRWNWARIAEELSSEIDYPNFKDAVAKRDKKRAGTYLKVWKTLQELEVPRLKEVLRGNTRKLQNR